MAHSPGTPDGIGFGAVHPEWDPACITGGPLRRPRPDAVGGELFTTSLVEDLPLPKKPEFLFRYEIMELNTAVKPTMFAHLRSQGYERVVYIDPDILVVDRLEDVERLLDEGANAVVTPHLTAPLDDGHHPTELEIMRAGAYNLGFLAIAGTPAADAFIAWWQDKLEYGAVSDPARGLFTDQKWVDLAPGMFGGFAVLRDPGYNVAYWNLPHRPITRENDVWSAGGSRLRFFHFSGFDPNNPRPFSKHQDRLNLNTIGEARELALAYASKVLGHGYVQFRARPYAFGTFDDGLTIPAAIRVLFREVDEVHQLADGDPFSSGALFALGESGGLPIILRGLWLQHQHLQRAFPDPLGSSREAYYRWFTEDGAVEIGIAEAFVRPVSRALNSLLANPLGSVARGAHIGGSIWTRCLVFLHRRATGGKLSPSRLQQYQQVNGPSQFMLLCIRQFRGSRWAARVGVGLPVSARLDPLRAVVAGVSSAASSSFTPRWRGERHVGLYPESGKEAWWMGRQARFIVDRTQGTRLRLRGIHVAELHQRAHGHCELNIAVGIDDEPRRTVRIISPGPFDVQVDMETLPQKWPATLHVVPETSFVPSEIGVADDQRRLTVQIARIDIGDCNVFDAARSSLADSGTVLGVPGVNVIGYTRSEHGVGQSLRQFTATLDACGMPSAIIDFNHNNLSRIEDRSLEHRLVAEPAYGINVFHINADQMPEAEMHLPAHFLARYNIGFWHWELPEMLEQHLAGFHRLNEVWVPTAFVQDAVAKKSPVPVVRMPHAIRFKVSDNAGRSQFGLPENKFLFLMMYVFYSYQDGKFPQAALEALERAFPRGTAYVALVI